MTSQGAPTPSIVWLRDDLRVADNPAFAAAADRGAPVVAVYVLDEVSEGVRPLGGAAKWWLHHALVDLESQLAGSGVPLTLRRGPAAEVIPALIAECGAGAIFWNRRYGHAERAVDTAVKSAAVDAGLDARSFGGSLLFEPWTVQTGQGSHYSVFTPFWRACQNGPPPHSTLGDPDGLTAPEGRPTPSDQLASWALLPTAPDWAGGLAETWTPTSEAGLAELADFLDARIPDYADSRDLPSQPVTSRLSPYLRWGQVSPHRVWHELDRHRRKHGADENTARFGTELGWREFCYHLLFHLPDLATVNVKPEFDAFPWPPVDDELLRAWQTGQTGVPLVDAGMRELWQTGVMHNRVRMVTASFLTKNLLIDWRIGEAWFWDTLVDADPASNPANWQWVAGSGADAAPYFRVFNPVLQQDKFDKQREYVTRYVPEVDSLGYPEPVVDLRASRQRALDAYEDVKRAPRSR